MGLCNSVRKRTCDVIKMIKRKTTATVAYVEIFRRTLYGAPFDNSECEYCCETSNLEQCPFCGYPKDIEFLEEDDTCLCNLM